MLSVTPLSNDRAAFSLDVPRTLLYADGAASFNAHAALHVETQSGVRLIKTLLRDRRAASLTLNTAPDVLSGVSLFRTSPAPMQEARRRRRWPFRPSDGRLPVLAVAVSRPDCCPASKDSDLPRRTASRQLSRTCFV